MNAPETTRLRYRSYTEPQMLDRITQGSELATMVITRRAVSLTVTFTDPGYCSISVTGPDRRDVLERALAKVEDVAWTQREAAAS